MNNKSSNNIKTSGAMALFSGIPVLLSAEVAVQPGGMVDILERGFLIFSAFVVLACIAFLYRFAFLLLQQQKKQLYKEQGLELPKVTKTPTSKRFYDWFSGLAPLSKEADIMLDHDYDGIKELDNSLPPWWVAMFYITIIIGVAYLGYYHYYDYGLSSREYYALEMKYAEEAQARLLEKQANAVNESNVVALTDEASLAGGAAIYKASCASCHGLLGEGLVGPNMTDDYWIHGGDIKDIFKTVKYGVPAKGMIAWKTQMNAASMHQVSSYILTMKGTNPPNQKAAEGTLYEAKSEE